MGQTRLVKKACSAFTLIILCRNQFIEILLKFSRSRRPVPQRILSHIVQSCVTGIRPGFHLGMPQRKGITVLTIPSWNRAILIAVDRESKFRIHADLNQVWPSLVDSRHDAVHPIAVIHFGVLVIRACTLLQLQSGRVRIV